MFAVVVPGRGLFANGKNWGVFFGKNKKGLDTASWVSYIDCIIQLLSITIKCTYNHLAMPKNQPLQAQAERMQQLTKELLRRYQMRDRNEITCCGITVSQCYALDALGDHGEMTMVQLAGRLYLDKSTATRAIDPLVERGLVQRRFGEQDRREILVSLTPAGEKLHQEIIASLLASQRQILERIPPKKREDILAALEILSSAMQDWLETCCLPRKVQLQTKGKKGA